MSEIFIEMFSLESNHHKIRSFVSPLIWDELFIRTEGTDTETSRCYKHLFSLNQIKTNGKKCYQEGIKHISIKHLRMVILSYRWMILLNTCCCTKRVCKDVINSRWILCLTRFHTTFVFRSIHVRERYKTSRIFKSLTVHWYVSKCPRPSQC